VIRRRASAVHCVCRGNAKETRGTAFVVYEDIFDAKNAVDHLSGFNVANRYLIVLYYQQAKLGKKMDAASPLPTPSHNALSHQGLHLLTCLPVLPGSGVEKTGSGPPVIRSLFPTALRHELA
jgi:RNA recognition motif-containing protein